MSITTSVLNQQLAEARQEFEATSRAVIRSAQLKADQLNEQIREYAPLVQRRFQICLDEVDESIKHRVAFTLGQRVGSWMSIKHGGDRELILGLVKYGEKITGWKFLNHPPLELAELVIDDQALKANNEALKAERAELQEWLRQFHVQEKASIGFRIN